MKPRNFVVNGMTGVCEMHVEGSLYQRRLEKVRAILAALPPDSFVMPPKALWEYYIRCYENGKDKDAYKVRFVVRNAAVVSQALSAL